MIPRTMEEAAREMAARYGTTRSAVLTRALSLYLAEHTDWKPVEVEGLP